MSILQRPAPMIQNPAQVDEWRPVILTGPYLKRMRCRLLVNGQGQIVDSDRIHCLYSGTAKFGPWFVALYHPVFLRAAAPHWARTFDQPAA